MSFAGLAAGIDLLPDWQRTVTLGTQALYGASIAVDASDNIYVTGSLPAATIVTARYDQAGNQIWQREFDNPGTREQASWITVDARGDVIVAGYTVAGSTNDGTGAVALKYDPDGNLLWNDIMSVPRGLTVRAAVDGEGNIFVVGRAFVSNSHLSTTDDMMTIRYLPDGTRDWVRYAGAIRPRRTRPPPWR